MSEKSAIQDKQKSLLDFLVGRQLLSPQSSAEAAADMGAGKTLDEIVQEKNLINVEDYVRAKAEFFNFAYVDLTDKNIDTEILNIIPANIAEHYNIIAFAKEDKRLKVGLLDAANFKAIEAMDFLAQKHSLKVDYYLISRFSFESAYSQYKNFNKEISSALAVKAKEEAAKNPEEKVEKDMTRFEDIVKDAPVAKIVSVIIRHAIEGGASDIHIEPLPKESRVRYRIDGLLHNSLVLPKDIHEALVARVKVLSNLKLDETRSPQDGRIRLVVDDREIDFRVSVMPLLDSEKVVMRVLDTSKGIVALDKLGFTGWTNEVLQKNFSKTGGMMLITGPTGSGKTTTLYSILDVLNKEKTNIVTLEDPIEYQIKGINQSQVHPEIGFTFASGLRSILRQDPDIIMVGEIRDNETAELAIHSALTGHLVLSTLHTKDAVGTIARLIDMKVEPFLLGSTLNVILAQRLARRICSFCKIEDKMEPGYFQTIKDKIARIPVEQIKLMMPEFDPSKITFFKGEGCSHCGKTGYRSRISIGEIIDCNQALRDLVIQKHGGVTIEDVRANQPFVTIEEDGLIKAMQGLTTVEEVMRVIQN